MSLLAACAIPNGSSSALVSYQRSGGIAGADDKLLIAPDGTATLTRKGQQFTFALDVTTVQQIEEMLDKASFTQLPSQMLPGNTCCDLFAYEITYKNHTVRTMDTAVPESLQPALDLLNGIVESNGKP